MTSLQVHIEALPPCPLLPSSFDMRRVLRGVNTYLNPSRDSFQLKHQVLKVQDGIVGVYFELPEGMLNCFVDFLQNMANFFKPVSMKEKSVAAQQRTIDLEEEKRLKDYKEEIRKNVCDKYDKYIKDGCSKNEAISLTNSSLKEFKYPNLSYEIVKGMLRSEGRLNNKLSSK